MLEGFSRSLLLRFFLGAADSAAQTDLSHVNLGHELPFMRRSAFLHDTILKSPQVVVLRELLQLRLVIIRLQLAVKRDLRKNMIPQKLPHRLQPLIEIQCTDERFEHIGQQRWACPPSRQLFAFAKQHILAELQLIGKFDEEGSQTIDARILVSSPSGRVGH